MSFYNELKQLMILQLYAFKSANDNELHKLTHLLETESVQVEIIASDDYSTFYTVYFKLLYIREFALFHFNTTLQISVKIQDLLVVQEWNNGDLIDSKFEIQCPKLTLLPDCHLSKKSLNHVALGGTFDHIHSGHYLLLYSAAFLTNTVTVGIVEQPKKNQPQLIQTFQQRCDIVRAILEPFVNDVFIVPLNDPHGPTVTDPTIDGLVASQETLKNSQQINDIRQEKQLQPLQLIIVDTLPDFKHGGKLSSSKIRDDLAKQ